MKTLSWKKLKELLGVMFVFSGTHAKTIGVSKGKIQEIRMAHRQIRKLIETEERNEKR